MNRIQTEHYRLTEQTVSRREPPTIPRSAACKLRYPDMSQYTSFYAVCGRIPVRKLTESLAVFEIMQCRYVV